MDADNTEWIALPAWAAVLALFWCGVVWFCSHLNGWTRLARVYRAPGRAEGVPVRAGGAHVGRGFSGYFRNVLVCWVSAHGLRLHVTFPFGINMPDLLIPWQDLGVERGRHAGGEFLVLRAARVPDLPVRLYGEAGVQVQAAAGPHWPVADRLY